MSQGSLNVVFNYAIACAKSSVQFVNGQKGFQYISTSFDFDVAVGRQNLHLGIYGKHVLFSLLVKLNTSFSLVDLNIEASWFRLDEN